MDTEILGFVLDIVVLACLAATIVFAVRLTRSLNHFKAYRDEFNSLVETLSKNIDQAQRAVINLKSGSHETADELRGLITRSRNMIDELKLMNEAADNLANRLEGLAEKSGQAVAAGRQGYNQGHKERSRAKPAPWEAGIREDDFSHDFDEGDIEDLADFMRAQDSGYDGDYHDDDVGSDRPFAIHDPDFSKPSAAPRGADHDGDNADAMFQSQAEKELYQALRGNRKKKKG